MINSNVIRLKCTKMHIMFNVKAYTRAHNLANLNRISSVYDSIPYLRRFTKTLGRRKDIALYLSIMSQIGLALPSFDQGVWSKSE